MHHSATDVQDQLTERPRDAAGHRTTVILLDEGDSTWDGAAGKIARARNGGGIIGVAYVETLDGHIHTRPIQTPVRSKP